MAAVPADVDEEDELAEEESKPKKAPAKKPTSKAAAKKAAAPKVFLLNALHSTTDVFSRRLPRTMPWRMLRQHLR